MTSPEVGTERHEALSAARLKIGVICGFLAVVTYTLILVTSLPIRPSLVLVCTFGPSLAIGSAGVYELLRLHRRTVTLDIGLVANIVAGAVVTVMFLAQLGLKEWFAAGLGGSAKHVAPAVAQAAFQGGNGIQLGMDVAWDIFLAIGTAAFAWNMRDHPRFGWAFAVTGLGIAAALAMLNLAAFPENPGNAGSIDVGPLVGLWYLAVTLRMAWSLPWIRGATARPKP